ncbi:AarF/ABC1/UbiB kinase family protein [Candidatus Woesearchaeota archaeon]|nr:AarF/ABC1/UbiB kinase family protein [Nanoarchaeota archaeon]MCB9371052.1 AarF/ABC1/UbiB kinase family protein [Candidatus Woesearchaeota archaeon]USN44231.1 MAG: AarF/ABC1/UbiB kinase family protein [Candidatus Woesearchaeota archaeon]
MSWSSSKRIREIARALYEYGFFSLLEKLNLLPSLPFHQRIVSKESSRADPQKIVSLFERLGGAFIKLGQVLALRPDLIGKEYSVAFEKLLDGVQSLSCSQIKGELGSLSFASFDHVCLGSGSIAQVHRAVLHSGEVVAVKIRRPGVVDVFHEDIALLEKAARLLAKRKLLSFVDVEEVVAVFKRYTLKELDFSHEALALQRFAKHFKGYKGVRIPKVYSSLSSSSVLVMEFVGGEKLEHCTFTKKEGEKIVSLLSSAVYKMIFEDRFFHADLHPGNILYEKGTLTFLDFGIVGMIDEELEAKLFSLFSGLVRGDLGAVSSALIDLHIGDNEVDEQVLRDGIVQVLGDYYDRSLKEMNFGEIFYGAVDVARMSHLKLPSQLVLFGKSLVTMEGFCRAVSPSFNIVRDAKPYVEKLAGRQLKKSLSVGEMKRSLVSAYLGASKLPKLFTQSLRRFGVIEKNIVDIDSTFNRLTDVIWLAAKSFSLTILFAVFFVAGVLLLETGLLFYGISLVALLCFFVSFLLLFGLISLLRKE